MGTCFSDDETDYQEIHENQEITPTCWDSTLCDSTCCDCLGAVMLICECGGI
jgi:hypothetical protein